MGCGLLATLSCSQGSDSGNQFGWASSRTDLLANTQETRANKRTPRIVGVSKDWASVFVQFFRLIDQLGRDPGTLGVPLSQWDTPGLQNRFLFRACGYHQIMMNALSHLKRFHMVTF